MQTNILVDINKITKQRHENKANRHFDHLIQLLKETSHDSDKGMKRFLSQSISWLESEKTKLPHQRSHDTVYEQWQNELNCRHQKSLLRNYLTLLHWRLQAFMKSRKYLRLFSWIQSISPKQNYDTRIKLLTQRHKGQIQELKKCLQDVKRWLSTDAHMKLDEFNSWFESDLKQPVLRQAKNKCYQWWRKTMCKALCKECNVNYTMFNLKIRLINIISMLRHAILRRK